MIEFRIDARSGVATYLQVVQQVRNALRLGMLEPGDQLPTVKEAVAQMAINPNTVLKAYRELENAGLVEGRPGQGTFVLKTLGGPPPPRQAAIKRGLERWMSSALDAGLDIDAIEALFGSVVSETRARGVA